MGEKKGKKGSSIIPNALISSSWSNQSETVRQVEKKGGGGKREEPLIV